MNELIWIMYESDSENVLSDHENDLNFPVHYTYWNKGDNQAILSIEIWDFLITHNHSLIIHKGKSLDWSVDW